MFEAIVPSKMFGFWRIRVIWSLKAFKSSFAMSLSSITILPSEGDKALHRSLMNDDFPAPVLPTIPTFWPLWIVRSTLLITGLVLVG